MNHPENACTCSSDRRCYCKRMLIGSTRSANQMSYPVIFLGDTLTAPVSNVETFNMGSIPNCVVRSMRILVKMSEFSVTRSISFHLAVFSMALYHCPLPSLEVRFINFVSNISIAVEYLGVGTGRTTETAVATTVVMTMGEGGKEYCKDCLGYYGSRRVVFVARIRGSVVHCIPHCGSGHHSAFVVD